MMRLINFIVDRGARATRDAGTRPGRGCVIRDDRGERETRDVMSFVSFFCVFVGVFED